MIEFQNINNIIFLTGAGISAESGLPTFRGNEGYWTIGSNNYFPEEMATNKMFRKRTIDIWSWYIHRYNAYSKCEANEGHKAIKLLENSKEYNASIITQNVDFLHESAGSSSDNIYHIHGCLNYVRCFEECTSTLFDFPSIELVDNTIDPKDISKLKCPNCNAWLRPHVLWFDESYDEKYYKLNSSFEKVEEADLIILIGTSGATNLPQQIIHYAINNNIEVIEVNLEKSRFYDAYKNHPHYQFIQDTASNGIANIVENLV